MRGSLRLCIAIGLPLVSSAGCGPAASTCPKVAAQPASDVAPSSDLTRQADPARPGEPPRSSEATVVLPPEASAISFEQMSRYPAPGIRLPRKIQYSPDAKSITYLQAETKSPVMTLFTFNPASRETKVLLRPTDLTKEARQLSPEEELRRERQRQRAQGITDYLWAEKASVMLIPFGGDVFVRAESGAVTRLTTTTEPEIDPQICANGERVVFVRGSELYSIDVASRRETKLTTGAPEGITRGQSDFNGQEEFDEPSGFWISPQCDKVAYLEVDQRELGTIPVVGYRGGNAELMLQKYPLAGGKNPKVKAGIVDLKTQKTTWLKWPGPLPSGERYFGRFQWGRGDELFAQALTRDQKRLALVRFDASSGEGKELITETRATWIDFAMMRPLSKSPRFVWSTERGGYIHLDLRDAATGAVVTALTSESWDVDLLNTVDEEHGQVWFTGTKDGPLDRQLYSVPIAGGEIRRRTAAAGVHSAVVERSGRGFVDVSSALDRRPSAAARSAEGELAAELPAAVDPELDGMKVRSPEIISTRGPSGDTLYGALLKPRVMEPGRRYPLVVMVYGGPGYQTVTNAWQPALLWNHLADRGVAVFQMDNRGTPGRGVAFERALYGRVGEVELADQLAGLDAVGALPFIDSSRAGIYGMSYGGTMTLVALLKAPDRFKVGVAGAPVTDWRLYDSGYTERFLGPLGENAKAYEATNLNKLAPNLRSKLLLVHGMMDENVHFQNTAQMIDALVAASKPFDMLLLPGERHGSRNPATRQYETRRIVDYLTEHL